MLRTVSALNVAATSCDKHSHPGIAPSYDEFNPPNTCSSSFSRSHRRLRLPWLRPSTMISCTVFLVLLIASLLMPSFAGDAGTKADPDRPHVVLREGKKYAYVMIHYEGTPRDQDYVYGLRTLISSLKQTGTTHDIVVLCSPNVSERTRQLVQEDGGIIQDVPNIPNPYKDADERKRRKYSDRFEFSLNKLYLWNMTQYERIVYLDEDNIALYNTDELFMCGHFCVVYLNPLFFHTGLMVVKPDTDMFDHLIKSLYSDSSYSHDGADQGFLVSVFRNLEDASLFDPYQGINEERMQRISLGYNFNHVYHYPYMAWDVHRRNPRFKNLEIPCLTIAYPIAQWLKPWNWTPAIFFNLHHLWQEKRMAVTHDSYNSAAWVVSRLVILAGVYFGWMWVFHLVPLHYTNSRWFQAIRNGTYRMLQKMGPNLMGFVTGAAAVFLPVVLWIRIVLPQLAPPNFAWPLFILYHNICSYLCLCLLAVFLGQHFASPFSFGLEHAPTTAPPLSAMVPSTLAITLTWLLGFPMIYDNFVSKVCVLFVGVAICVLFHLNLFIQLCRAWEQKHKRGAPVASAAETHD